MSGWISRADIVARIEQIRADETPGEGFCPTCGSATPEPITEKWCPGCKRRLPAARFSRNRSRYDGLQSQCRACQAINQIRRKRRQRVASLRRAS